jgi:hypothetical protein
VTPPSLLQDRLCCFVFCFALSVLSFAHPHRFALTPSSHNHTLYYDSVTANDTLILLPPSPNFPERNATPPKEIRLSRSQTRLFT